MPQDDDDVQAVHPAEAEDAPKAARAGDAAVVGAAAAPGQKGISDTAADAAVGAMTGTGATGHQQLKRTGSSVGSEDSTNNGRWMPQEHEQFLIGYQKFGKDWKRIAAFMGTRTNIQCRTHAQKFFKKGQRDTSEGDQNTRTRKRRREESDDDASSSEGGSASVASDHVSTAFELNQMCSTPPVAPPILLSIFPQQGFPMMSVPQPDPTIFPPNFVRAPPNFRAPHMMAAPGLQYIDILTCAPQPGLSQPLFASSLYPPNMLMTGVTGLNTQLTPGPPGLQFAQPGALPTPFFKS